LWRTTHDQVHLAQKDAELQKTRDALVKLDLSATSPEEKLILGKMKDTCQELQVAATAIPPSSIVSMKSLTKTIIDTAEQYHTRNEKQMEITVRDMGTLNRVLDYGLLAISVFVISIVALGSLALLRRIIQPTIALSQMAARFGQGNFTARARVMRDDELGNLCQTFNNMADDIALRENERHEFLASVVHDIKTPLVFIGGAVRMLKNKQKDYEKLPLWMDRIISQINRLDALTNDLIDTVQVQTGRLTLDMQEIDLTSLARTIQADQAECLSSHPVCFEGDEECRVLCDARRLERIAVNLISNAVKYSPEQTTILMKVYRHDSYGVLAVKDQGMGIAPEDLKLLFQPFGRLSRSKSGVKGTGLGLFTVKKIVEAHNGRVNVMSEPGAGTTIEILFPLA